MKWRVERTGAARTTPFDAAGHPRRHNAAQISDPEEPTARLFHDRPFRVIDAGRFAQACVGAIDAPLSGYFRSWER